MEHDEHARKNRYTLHNWDDCKCTEASCCLDLLTNIQGIVCFLFLSLHSSAILRRAFYETFLHLHQLVVITVLVVLSLHLKGLPQLVYLQVAISAWVIEVSHLPLEPAKSRS